MEINSYEIINPNEGNIVKLVEAIFSRALEMNATDIHIEPLPQATRIRLRIDGLLTELCRLPLTKHNPILSRIKLLSEMDIAEKRLPQDGRLPLSYKNKSIDLRVSTLPTIEGEKLAIRILDKSNTFIALDQLGFNASIAAAYQKIIHTSNGLILTTGPTGSGKTTTLYATLKEINTLDKNITSIEDPVEYRLEGVNQVAVNSKAGIDFNKSLRALVRQDPNIIMIGEIRDSQTAKIAVQAALTGHLVFSTLHTNSALGTVNRLLDMGVEPFLLLSALRGVLAQRLVRKICPHCKAKYTPSALEAKYIRQFTSEPLQLYKGKGCPICHNTGYLGRIAIHELVIMDDTLASMILHQEDNALQKQYLYQNGYKSLKEDALQKVLQGITTLDELYRMALID